MITCPICKTKLKDNQKSCPTCLFDDLRVEFLNGDEAEHWKQKIVVPYKKKYTQSLEKKTAEAPKISKAPKSLIHIENGRTFFGKYRQTKDGKEEPISWLVIKETEDKILLLSEKCLDVAPFYNVKNTYDRDYYTWFNSDLRHWLNNTFYNKVFSEKEKAQIIPYVFEETGTYLSRATSYRIESYKYDINDFVFALSKKEVPFSTRLSRAEPTEYAKSKGLKTYNPNTYSYWWLRDTGFSSASVVRPGGEVDERGYNVNSGFDTPTFSWQQQSNKIGVRPAIWIKK